MEGGKEGTLLMILHPPITLRKLRTLVYEMATEEEEIARCDGEGIAHEDY